MAVEIELKVRAESNDAMRERLRACGAEFVERVMETNRIFDRADGSLRNRGCGLRVRSTVGGRSDGRDGTLTFKGPRSPGPLKSREEIEFNVSDAQVAVRILGHLEFVPVLTYEKRRESWTLDGCRIELDEPACLGPFVEIEGPDEKTIRAVQAKLGLSNSPPVRASYVEMLVRYCEEHGLTERTLSFRGPD